MKSNLRIDFVDIVQMDKRMKVAYIDTDEAKGRAFFRALCKAYGAAHCELLHDPHDTVEAIRDTTFAPDYIFIHFEYKAIPCVTLVSTIKRQSHLKDTKVIILSEYFTRRDILLFRELDADTRLVRTEELAAALTEIFNPAIFLNPR